MVRLHAAHGSTAEYSRKKVTTGRTNAIPKTFWGTAGDLHGQTIAASSTTGLQLGLTGNPGVSARSWSGGIHRKRNGPGWIMPIMKKRRHRMPRPMFMRAAVR